MTITYREIGEAVETKVSKRTINSMVTYLERENLVLGGHQQPRHIIRYSVYLQLYKDAFHISYNKLSKETKRWYDVNHKTLDKNIKRVRKKLNTWGMNQITSGSLSEWKRAVKRVKLPKSIKNVTLWIDSTDCQYQRHGYPLKQHPLYSGKIQKVALRRMVVSDGRRRIRYFSTGYTPKLYDSHWGKINKIMLNQEFGMKY